MSPLQTLHTQVSVTSDLANHEHGICTPFYVKLSLTFLDIEICKLTLRHVIQI